MIEPFAHGFKRIGENGSIDTAPLGCSPPPETSAEKSLTFDKTTERHERPDTVADDFDDGEHRHGE